jgi:hypothetical protein
MAMEWKDYSQVKPHRLDWSLVWIELYSGHEGYPDTDYWDGTNWTSNVDTPISWWFEITPPPINKKDRKNNEDQRT